MAGLVEVLVEGAPAHVDEVAADLARELDAEPVQLVQPVRDRLAVPGQGQFERVVHFRARVAVGVRVVSAGRVGQVGRRVGEEGVEFHLALPLGHALFALHVDARGGPLGGERRCEFRGAEFALCDGAFFEIVDGARGRSGRGNIGRAVRRCSPIISFAGLSVFDVFLAGEVVLVNVVVFEFLLAVQAPDAFACALCLWGLRPCDEALLCPSGNGV